MILVILVAPVANAWCATSCIAAAISGGCAHELQPIDDLPMAKSAAAPVVQWTPVATEAVGSEGRAETRTAKMPAAVPLRI